jgi:lysozyme
MAYSVIGIDVSHYRVITAYAALPANVKFIGAKATQGKTFVDGAFAHHRDGFRTSNKVGAIYYHYAGGGNPLTEADFFLSTIGDLKPNERVALDVEGKNPVSLPWIQKFMSAMPLDRIPIFYGGNETWRTIGNPDYPDATVGKVHLWSARYQSGDNEPVIPAPWSFWTFWQFTEHFQCSGVSDPCDGNYFHFDDAALIKYFTL